MSSQSTTKELFLSENEFHHVFQNQIDSLKMRIHYDHRYEESNTDLNRRSSIYKTRFVVRNTYDIQIKSTNVLQLYSPCREELELITHNRRRLLDFSKSSYIDIPLLTFIDAFELYRNMYRSILEIYITIVELN